MALQQMTLTSAHFENALNLIRKEERPKYMLVADSTWVELLEPLSGPDGFGVLVADDLDNLRGKLIGNPNAIIICCPKGEDELAGKIRLLVHGMETPPLILRFLRDLFMRKSFRLEKSLDPQVAWKVHPDGTNPYFIFAVPRTGSSFLSDVLKSTGLLGRPQEHLQKDVAAFLQATDLKIEEWLASLVRYSFTPNGSSGTKLISHLFLDVLADIQNDQERMQKLEAFFKGKKVIYIKRMNRIRQAISLVKAKKSGVWHIKDKRLIKSEASSADLDITSPLISETINWITTQEKGMELFFEEFHLKPLVVYYEELEGQSSRQAVLDNIFRFLEVEVPHLESKTAYKPMADEESDQLFQAFVSDFYNSIRQGIGHFDAPAEIILESLVAELKHREPDRHMKHGPLQHLLKKWKLSR